MPSGKKYRPWNPAGYRDLRGSPKERLPEDDLVFFFLDVLPSLDLQAFDAPYEQDLRGAPPFDPALLVTLLLYSYSVGVYSSRKIAQACQRNLAFLARVGDDRPDFRTIRDFRQRHLEALADLFTQVLKRAHAAGLVRLGLLATDGTKIGANASRHKARSYDRLCQEEPRLQNAIQELLKKADATDAQEDAALGSRADDQGPDELARREARLLKIQEAKKRLEEEAQAKAEEAKQHRAAEEARRAQEGRRRPGKAPAPGKETPEGKAQSNFTDPEMTMMPQSNKGWDYAGNAQAVVDSHAQIILTTDVVATPGDAAQAVPMAGAVLAELKAAGIPLPGTEVGCPERIPRLDDAGYYSAKAVVELEEMGFDPFIATKRQKHNAGETPTAREEDLEKAKSAKAKMAAKLRTERGKKLYARRKVIVEPVFGQIKGARGFRRFSLRGLDQAKREWRLVGLTHNLLKISRSGYAPNRN